MSFAYVATMTMQTVPFRSSEAVRRRAPRANWYVLRRLLQKEKLEKVFVERLTEPLHLNALSAFVALFGSYRLKVAFDLVVRQQYAFPILYAADAAKQYGYKSVTLVELAARYRLPAIYPLRAFTESGGLLSYGFDQDEQFRQAASYAARILMGEKSANLPVQAPTKFNFVINLRTAKALNIETPPTLLARADEIIE